jgi:8-oxo-dGTP diphosphatase
MPKNEFTTMVMIQDKKTGKVLIIDRVKSWKGLAFPGGHAEDGESFYDCAVREIKEETGFDIWNLKSCGFIHWHNNKTGDRYFTYFYKTTDFSGQLIGETGEGKVFWAKLTDFPPNRLAPNMGNYMPMFSDNGYSEAYCSWNDDDPGKIVYK